MGFPRINKYRNKPVIIDGTRFASTMEGNRYRELKLLERAGAITDLKLQPRYPIVINGVKVTTYVGDFEYQCTPGPKVTEDTKGTKTTDYIIKKKLMFAVYGITIVDGLKPRKKRK